MFPSELAADLIGDRDPSKEDPSEMRFIPTRRFGGEEEMAGSVLYLASRAGAVSTYFLNTCFGYLLPIERLDNSPQPKRITLRRQNC